MKTVLIVDDSPIVLETTRTILQNAGYRVVIRARAEGTVATILHERPDLVLLDVNMPHLSGEMIAVILARADPQRCTLVLLHSSLPADQFKTKAQEVGAHGFIHKGTRPNELVNQVNRWLRHAPGSSQNMRRATVDPEPAPESLSSPARAARANAPVRKLVPDVLFVDDDHFALSFYRRSLQNEPINLDLADTGGRALERIRSDNPPDVIVCDLQMPDTDGKAVFERAVELDGSWRQRFIFVAEATSVVRISQFLTDATVQVLYKPIDLGLLKLAVRQAVSACESIGGSVPKPNASG